METAVLEKRKIKRITVACSVNYCGFRYYEMRHYWDDEHGKEVFNTTKLSFSLFKGMGTTKSFNGTKKINSWLATEEGRSWYIAGLNKEMMCEMYE